MIDNRLVNDSIVDRTFWEVQAICISYVPAVDISYITIILALLGFTSCLSACNLIKNVLVNGVLSWLELRLYLFQKLLIIVKDSIVLFNLMSLEIWYHGQLVLLEV